MFRIEPVDDCYRIAGYADGSDWLLPPGRHRAQSHGLVAADHVWLYDDNAELHIFNATARRRVATLAIGEKHQFGHSCKVSLSRDEQKLYALVARKDDHVLHIVDPKSGKIAASHIGLRGCLRAATERPDGKLLIEVCSHHTAAPKLGLVLLHPATGRREESWSDNSEERFGFIGHSPDGRWWLRLDRTRLPVFDDEIPFWSRLVGRKPERYYGVSMQLWEAFPLRFVRRLTVGWFPSQEMPDNAAFSVRNDITDPDAAQRAMWDTIAATLARADVGPTGEVPRSAFPTSYVADEDDWRRLKENVQALGGPRTGSSIAGWQPDSQAFWFEYHGFLSCVGVDGALSPRLFTERMGQTREASPSEWYTNRKGWIYGPPFAKYGTVVPMNFRKAEVRYAEGTALFDGSPSDTPHRMVQIPKADDRWVPADQSGRKFVKDRVKALKSDAKKVFVPLAAWSEAGSIAAIDALTAMAGPGFVDRAVDSEIAILFQMGGENITEQRFFTTVRERFPAAAPAIRRLIERYVGSHPRHVDVYSHPEDVEQSIALLGPAAHALGVLDPNSLVTLRRYGMTVDLAHENYFTASTIPAIVAAHGWTEPVTDFVIWVLLRGYGNGSLDYPKVWHMWGMEKAARRQTPEAFARRVMQEFVKLDGYDDDPGQYGASGMDRLATDLPKPHDAWLRAFFAELRRMAGQAQAVPA